MKMQKINKKETKLFFAELINKRDAQTSNLSLNYSINSFALQCTRGIFLDFGKFHKFI